MFQSWTPLGLDLIFKKAVRTNHPQSTYDETHESRSSRHIESGDKKQSEWKCNHVRSPHRARHDIASDVCIASCGASACISRRNIECGESGNDLHRSQCVDNPCRCLPQKRLTLDGSIRGDVDVAHQFELLRRSSPFDLFTIAVPDGNHLTQPRDLFSRSHPPSGSPEINPALRRGECLIER